MGKILVIDDNETVLRATAKVLQRDGHEVIVSRDPLCAQLILDERPEIVLLDVKMPTLQGDILARVLVKSEYLMGKMIILLHSALPEEALQAKVREAGVDGYILKSGDPASLSLQVFHWLEVAQGKART